MLRNQLKRTPEATCPAADGSLTLIYDRKVNHSMAPMHCMLINLCALNMHMYILPCVEKSTIRSRRALHMRCRVFGSACACHISVVRVVR